MNRSPYRLLVPIWAMIISALAAITWPFHDLKLYSPTHSWWTLLASQSGWIAGLGIRTYWKIRSEFGVQNFIGEAELRHQTETPILVTTEMHAQMRHPIYAAHLLLLAAWALGSGLLVPFVLLGVSLFVTFPLMIWIEEQELEQRFGSRYQEYKQTVPVLAMPLFTRAAGKKPA